jgi:hypothetical protein
MGVRAVVAASAGFLMLKGTHFFEITSLVAFESFLR